MANGTSRSAKLPNQGDLLGDRFRLGSIIARGAMGVVFNARDEKTGEELAVKILPPMANGVQARERFLREMELTSTVHHPNVVRTVEIGLHEGTRPYIAMEKLVGQTLAQSLRKQTKLSIVHAVLMLSQVALALEGSHKVGVLHRDIKPGNIFLADRGAVLFDFGLSIDSRRITRLTSDEMTVGTPGYMAPEQILEGALDARSDIYGATACAFEALTGERPIAPHATSVDQVFEAIVAQVPPVPSTLRSNVPPSVDRLLIHGLAKKPADRFQTAGELHDACIDAMNGIPDEEEA
ncbi:MAG: serine/threonine-protein kinase [Polyangiales bacterium]